MFDWLCTQFRRIGYLVGSVVKGYRAAVNSYGWQK